MLDDGLCHGCGEMKWHDGPCLPAARVEDNAKQGEPGPEKCRVCDRPIFYSDMVHSWVHVDWLKTQDLHQAQPAKQGEPVRPSDTRCTWHSGMQRCTLSVDHLRDGQDCQFEPAAQPAKHTDDRQADTIPLLKRMVREYVSQPDDTPFQSFDDWLTERTGRAETRIEVLEAALRNLIHNVKAKMNGDPHWVDLTIPAAEAALAAPSGETKGNK